MTRLSALALLLSTLAAVTSAQEPTYVVEPPAGMYPYPHQRPDMSTDEHAQLMAELFVINNFAEYQFAPGGPPENAYLHSGIDLVMPNGTRIHSVAAGTVRAIYGSEPHYMTVVIEDRDQPGWAWTYTHVYDFLVKVGDTVSRGTPIAWVNFIRPGVDHLHLGRAYAKSGMNFESRNGLVHVNPEPLFPFLDAEPPRIEVPFRYARNGTFHVFTPAVPTVVSGEVDVVAGIRDDGLNSRAKGVVIPVGYTGVLAVSRLELEIRRGRDVVRLQPSFDFNRIGVDFRPGGPLEYPRLSTLYFPHDLLQPPPVRHDTLLYYYVVTNGDASDPLAPLAVSIGQRAWDTRQVPNGDYTVVVRAWDTAGNMAEAQDVVRVEN